jgi:hypothetical protein
MAIKIPNARITTGISMAALAGQASNDENGDQ